MILQILKKKDDPLALRISIGGNQKQAYLVYRGDLAKIKLLLDEVNERLKQLPSSEEPGISPDDGKKFA